MSKVDGKPKVITMDELRDRNNRLRMEKLIERKYPDELAVGIKVEMEHTDDPKEARKTAFDHLIKNPDYYSTLLATGLIDEDAAVKEADKRGLSSMTGGEKSVAIDFDGVLNTYSSGWKGPDKTDDAVPGAAGAIRSIMESGYKVIVYSTRANSTEGVQAIRDFIMAKLDIDPDSVEITDRKPIAEAYIDDRAINFSGNWKETVEKLKSFKPWIEKSIDRSRLVKKPVIVRSGGKVYQSYRWVRPVESSGPEVKSKSTNEPRDANGRLLAPNGKPSNLNERQWRQVRTPEFKAWFGDWETDPENASKVVDENGEPRVVFHGTSSQFDSFAKEQLGRTTQAESAKNGFFFSENQYDSANYAIASYMNEEEKYDSFDAKIDLFLARREPTEREKNVFKAYEKIKNSDEFKKFKAALPTRTMVDGFPESKNLMEWLNNLNNSLPERLPITYEIDERGAKNVKLGTMRVGYIPRGSAEGYISNAFDSVGEKSGAVKRALMDSVSAWYVAKELGLSIMECFLNARKPHEYDQWRRKINMPTASKKKPGHDSNHWKNVSDPLFSNHWIVFSPSQIKSATGNTGAFNPADPDIRKALDYSKLVRKPVVVRAGGKTYQSYRWVKRDHKKIEQKKTSESVKEIIFRDPLGIPSPNATVSVYGSDYNTPGRGYLALKGVKTVNDLEKRWPYESRDVSHIVKELESEGWECVVGKDGYNAPVIDCIHIATQEKLTSLKNRHNEKWENAKNVFIRYGDIPKRGYSIDHSTGNREKGVSVFRGKILPSGEVKPDIETDQQLGSLLMGELINRPVYVVEGEVVGTGADGEPVLKNGKQYKPKDAANRLYKSLTFSGWKLQGRMKIHGMDISIENRKGSVRRGKDKDGHKWKTKMNAHYGYIRGSVGVDKDHVDCYVGPNPESRKVFIVHQNDPTTGAYDEDKCMLGWDSAKEAKAAYLKQYDRPGFFGSMDETDVEAFKTAIFKKSAKGKRLVIKKSAMRFIGAILEKARKSPKLIPEKRMVTRDGTTFQTTVWVLPGQKEGSVQGGFDFDAPEVSGEKKIDQKKAKSSEVDKITDQRATKETDASLKRSRHDVMFEKPYTGKTGVKLLGYTWPHIKIEEVDKRGEDVVRRYSDWTQADISEMTGRKFVHKFVIGRTDGTTTTLSAESAAVALGISEDGVRRKARALLEEEIQKQKKIKEAKEEADSIVSGKWYANPAEAIESSNTPFKASWIKHRSWGDRKREYEKEYGTASDRHGSEEIPMLQGEKGFQFTFAYKSRYDGELEKRGIKEVRFQARDIWDENGNRRENPRPLPSRF